MTPEQPSAGVGREETSRPTPGFGAALGLAAGVVVVVVVAVVALTMASSGATEHRFVVAPGTGDRLDAGEWVETMPAELDVKVGDSLVIVNDDDRVHLIGPFGVRAGETLHYRFSEPGEIRDACTLQPDGEIVITIS
ncbi:MAG: hypothetical protein JJU45_07640 [Acidimicrobiia bacterium]|nr:hypothetical protein [Acidimicrobiia bacterium]